MYQSDVGKLNQQVEKLQADREQRIARENRLQAERNELHGIVEAYSSSRQDSEDDCTCLVEYLLPNIELIDNSLSFMLTEIQDYRAILRYLYRLNAGEKVPFKDFRGAADWLEINKKIGGGQSCDVRIYFRKVKDSSKYQVLVSEKEEQDLDARRLERHS
jgi:hypothetical protein